MNLSASETRVLGCMLEKQLTTPDIYPLTLNSLRLACNQSTNRDPVVDYDDAILRAPKYRHLLAEALPMAGDEQAVICVLMLRGPQTPGELKQRAERMHLFADLTTVHHTLEQLIARELVVRLERRPGHKEERYAQLLQEEDASAAQQPRADWSATGGAPAPSPATATPSFAATAHTTPGR